MTGSIQDAVVVNMPMAAIIAHKIGRRLPDWIDEDDLCGAAYLGLVSAAARYDGRVKFNTFAEKRIRGAIFDMLRANDHLKRCQRRRVQTGEIVDPGAPLQWSGSDLRVALEPLPDELAAVLEIRRLIRDVVSGLPDRLQIVVLAYYFEGCTLAAIGVRLGVGEPRVFQLKRQALKLLRKAIAAR